MALHFSADSEGSARQQLLQLVPTDATVVIFLDAEEFRQSPFLAKLYSWAPHPSEDSEYSQFVVDTGFSYERDLRRIVLAISSRGPATDQLAIADGNFDRKKIEAYLARNGQPVQQGKWKIFRVKSKPRDKTVSIAFLSDHRIALVDSADFAANFAAANKHEGQTEWNARFDRLAGSPLFAVIRQDPTLQNALSSAARGGLRSPQLSSLLERLQWASIAGKPDGDSLRVIAEGESSSEPIASQLQDFLQGVLLLAQNGLNDPKLRQQLNPEEREAYLELLQSAEIQKVNRGEWKTIRLVFSITPKFLDVAKVPYLGIRSTEKPEPPDNSQNNSRKPRSKSASRN